MGNSTTKGGDEPVNVSVEELATQNKISVEEVESLLAAFKNIEKGEGGGRVGLEKFRGIVKEVYEMKGNATFSPDHAELIFSIMDTNKDGSVDVMEFVHGVTVLSSGSMEEKGEFVFKTIDTNNSGTIERKELCAHVSIVLKVMHNIMTSPSVCSPSVKKLIGAAMKKYKKKILQEVVEEAFTRADTNKDDKISLEEWMQAVRAGDPGIIRFLDPWEDLAQCRKEINRATSDLK